LELLLFSRDPELVEEVLMKNFSHFTDRGLDFDVKKSSIDNNLFTMKGEHWRDMRYKLSPAFTSAKLKNMFHEAQKCSERMIR
jgi:cytochrome P450 family 6